jgi:hypothetical protein
VKLMVFNDKDFGYFKKSNSQLSFESGLCHMGDHAGGVRDPDDARQRDPR